MMATHMEIEKRRAWTSRLIIGQRESGYLRSDYQSNYGGGTDKCVWKDRKRHITAGNERHSRGKK